jgi:hypothetical protein
VIGQVKREGGVLPVWGGDGVKDIGGEDGRELATNIANEPDAKR